MLVHFMEYFDHLELFVSLGVFFFGGRGSCFVGGEVASVLRIVWTPLFYFDRHF